MVKQLPVIAIFADGRQLKFLNVNAAARFLKISPSIVEGLLSGYLTSDMYQAPCKQYLLKLAYYTPKKSIAKKSNIREIPAVTVVAEPKKKRGRQKAAPRKVIVTFTTYSREPEIYDSKEDAARRFSVSPQTINIWANGGAQNSYNMVAYNISSVRYLD